MESIIKKIPINIRRKKSVKKIIDPILCKKYFDKKGFVIPKNFNNETLCKIFNQLQQFHLVDDNVYVKNIPYSSSETLNDYKELKSFLKLNKLNLKLNKLKKTLAESESEKEICISKSDLDTINLRLSKILDSNIIFKKPENLFNIYDKSSRLSTSSVNSSIKRASTLKRNSTNSSPLKKKKTKLLNNFFKSLNSII